jgi:SPP1 gp7 family putative phage head morphogenesis protein
MMIDVIVEDLKNPVLNDAPSSPPLPITVRISRIIQKLSTASILKLMASHLSYGMVKRANNQNKDQIQKTYNAAFSIDLSGMLSNAVVKNRLEEAVKENRALITSIQTDFINDVGSTVFTNLSNGGRHENLLSLISERGRLSKVRAKFIARDQTAKLNSALTEARQKSLGVDLYEWGGAGDERQRQGHFVLNGKTCKYSDSTVYSDNEGKTWEKRKCIGAYEGSPGTDFQCRCVALPKISWD